LTQLRGCWKARNSRLDSPFYGELRLKTPAAAITPLEMFFKSETVNTLKTVVDGRSNQ